MRKIGLILMLGGLLLVVTGCGGGGKGGGESEPDILTTTKTIDMSKNGNTELNLRYTVATATGSSNTVTMTITSIDVDVSRRKIVVNCTWEATNRNGCPKIVKLSDNGTKTFYMYDNTHDTTTNNEKGVYYHTAGTGAAYTETTLSATAIAGSYTFPTLNRRVTSIYFYDKTYSKTFGPIAVIGLGL